MWIEPEVMKGFFSCETTTWLSLYLITEEEGRGLKGGDYRIPIIFPKEGAVSIADAVRIAEAVCNAKVGRVIPESS
jgi:hypothetical protein